MYVIEFKDNETTEMSVKKKVEESGMYVRMYAYKLVAYYNLYSYVHTIMCRYGYVHIYTRMYVGNCLLRHAKLMYVPAI